MLTQPVLLVMLESLTFLAQGNRSHSSQDKPNAVSVSELHEVLSLSSVSEDRKVFLLAAQMGSDGALRNSCQGLDAFQDLLLKLI